MRLIIISLAGAMALAACAEQTPPPEPDEAPAPGPASEAPPPATPAEPGPASPPATPAPADDCGAAERQGWIGRARADLPSAPAGALWRVYETGQPVTQDLRQNRLNIEIDPERQTVVRLSCG